MNAIQRLFFIVSILAAHPAYAMNIRAAINNVESYLHKLYSDEQLTDAQIDDAYNNLNSLKSSNPGRYEKLKDLFESALRARRTRQQEISAIVEPEKNISDEAQEFENFQDISNSIGAGLAEVESLLEQLHGVENMQARQQIVTIMDTKLQKLAPLFEAQKKFAHRNKTVIHRLKKRYTTAQANVAALKQEFQADLKHAQE